jgi:hypothetical protein
MNDPNLRTAKQMIPAALKFALTVFAVSVLIFLAASAGILFLLKGT